MEKLTEKTAPITNSYLMWIGSEHYDSIKTWVDEAKEQGVSKRLPNVPMAKALLAPGTVIFVAHDEGEHIECRACSGAIECRSCRKIQNAIANEHKFIDDIKADDPKAAKKRSNAEARIAKLDAQTHECEDCCGTFVAAGGTGGKVTFEDSTTWDYNKYQYTRNAGRLNAAIEAHGAFTTDMCKACGGFGRLPDGKVFGMFTPSALEYIDQDGSVVAEGGEEGEEGESASKAEEMAAAGFKVVPASALADEKKRKCGRRKVGGVYAVTSADDKAGAKAVKKMAKKLGLEVAVSGAFAEFLVPVSIPGRKRCRGLSHFDLAAFAGVAEEVALIDDAA